MDKTKTCNIIVFQGIVSDKCSCPKISGPGPGPALWAQPMSILGPYMGLAYTDMIFMTLIYLNLTI